MELRSIKYFILILGLIIMPSPTFENEVADDSDVREDEGEWRDPKFSIFQIIKFANDPCIGSNRNGTCFTKQECDNEGGTESGSCADGFGVCCIKILSDEGSTSLNQSYIVQASSTSLGVGSRQYTVCPCSVDVCRIRFDFTMFNLAAPFTIATGSSAAATSAYAVGDCQIDTFSITAPGFAGSPLICGTNEGQHMILDSDGTSCSKVNIGLGNGAGTTAREWDIKVTQYTCGSEDGGPPGCLQWHTTSTGSFRSFNFPLLARGAAVPATTTHLSNQEYDICIRTPSGANHMCYTTCSSPTAANAAIAAIQSSFGVSIANGDAEGNIDDTECSSDYLTITGGTSQGNAQAGALIASEQQVLFCGRALTTATDTAYADGGVSVCTFSQPFRVGVHFDSDETPLYAAAGTIITEEAALTANLEEFEIAPGGITGFSLCYASGTPAAG